MAGKTYIGGTAYDITGGKTLIGGTAYDINAGKTLIGGTAYDIVFKKPVTIKELFSDLTVLDTVGRNSSSASRIYLSTSITDTDHSAYLFSICEGGLSIWKVSGTLDSVSTTALKTGGHRATGIHKYTRSLRIYYRNNGYSSGTSTTTATAVYGATLTIVRFPNYDDTVVETILSQMSITAKANHNESTQTSTNINITPIEATNNKVILAAKNATYDIWGYNTEGLTRISGTTTAAATLHSSYLSVSGYGYSGIQLDYTPV